jgi:Carboxypeptidase regulatory-like domain
MHHWGKLTGRVTSASTHAPIEGVEVDAYDGSQHTAVTNANGEYTFSHLGNRSGEYTVSFSPRSGAGLDFFPQWYDDKESQLASDPVHVSLDHTTTGIDAALSEGGHITGRVTNAVTKQPLAEITVCAWSKIVFESRCAWTNSNGEYSIVRLPTDEYQVSFYTNSDNYYSVSYSGLVAVAIGHTTAGIDVAMEPVVKGTIMGSVREAVWAKSIPNIDVCAYDVEQEELFGECTKSNSAGWYELRGLAAGQYIVAFSSPGPGLEYATQLLRQEAKPAIR